MCVNDCLKFFLISEVTYSLLSFCQTALKIQESIKHRKLLELKFKVSCLLATNDQILTFDFTCFCLQTSFLRLPECSIYTERCSNMLRNWAKPGKELKANPKVCWFWRTDNLLQWQLLSLQRSQLNSTNISKCLLSF